MKNTDTPYIRKVEMLDQVRGKLRLKHYSICTERSYLGVIKNDAGMQGLLYVGVWARQALHSRRNFKHCRVLCITFNRTRRIWVELTILILAKINKGGFGTRHYAGNLIMNYQCIVNWIRNAES